MFKASKMKINAVYTDEYGIHPQGRCEVPSAEQKVEIVDIRGRETPLTKKYGYENILLPITFNMYSEDDSFKKVFRIAKQHLLNAKTLILDDDDEVYYKVIHVQIETAENLIRQFGEFTVNFTISPFQFAVGNNPVLLTEQTTIENPGYVALPIVKVWCEGTGAFSIGNQEIIIQNVNGTITIDSEMMNAYREGNPPQNMNSKMIGEFPRIISGKNKVSFSGGITKMEITPNFRWL